VDDKVKLRKLAEACARGFTDLEDMVQGAREGRCQFHEVEDAVGITSIVISGRYKICHLLGVAGTLNGLKELAPIIDAFARDMGCSDIYTVGRKGFEKYYKVIDPGFEVVGVAYAKNLEET
jgi:hypothetical protein